MPFRDQAPHRHPRPRARTRAALPVALALVACADRNPAAPAGANPPAASATTSGPSANRWSAPATWPGGTVPAAGAAVVIPAGRTVTLDVSPPALASLTVDGTLTVADSADVRLTTGGIVVTGAGRFEAGSEQHPFIHRLTITLTGTDDGTSVMGMGSKLIGVMGALELHGDPRAGWTRLAGSARAGATSLQLETNPGWAAGDRLVVASTEFVPTEAEEVTVAAVQGAAVTLAAPLQFFHYGERQTIEGRAVEERAEVGLLTRNVVVQGDSASSASGFGGHVMVMRGGTAHVEGVEFYRMGQRGRQARYPMHWHLAGDTQGQYARRNSIWRTENRCLTVHGTNGVLVAGNVCYDHPGHGYFVEDGSETGNTFDGNLGLGTRMPAAGAVLLPSDSTPSTYWITNPDNTFRNNVAAGSAAFGFWIALPEHPTGLSANLSQWPRQTPLREFSGNVAHSNRRPGLNVDNGPKPDHTTEVTVYAPRAVPGPVPGGDSTPVAAVYANFTAYKHAGRAVWIRGQDQRMTGAVLADNGTGATFAAVRGSLEDALVVGESGNDRNPLGGPNPTRGFQFYDGPVAARRSTFVNFRPSAGLTTAALSFNPANSFDVSTANAAEGLRFVDAAPVYVDAPDPNKDGDRAAVVRDADGSVTGRAGAYVVADAPVLVTADCARRVEWNAYVCPGRYAQFEVVADGDGALHVAPLDLTRDDGATMRMVGRGNGPRRVLASLPVGRGYVVRFAGGTIAQPRLTVRELGAGDWVRLAVPTAAATAGAVAVTRDDDPSHPLAAAASPAELDASAGDRYYLDAAAGLVYVKAVAAAGQTSVTFRIDPR